ncbi:MAG: hypothetical protein D3921_15365 [Candidatus Electrothrix sp. AW1]|nr:hypothetical protein [Candidatus Electrothrix gigas]
MRFNGTSWEQVGGAGFSSGSVYYNPIQLALDSSDRPYVAFSYRDSTNNSYKVGVMRFNGTSWEQVGTAVFSSNSVYNLSLALDSRGTPYVAFRYWDNTNNSSKIGVMRFVPDIAITPVYELLLLKKKQ